MKLFQASILEQIKNVKNYLVTGKAITEIIIK